MKTLLRLILCSACFALPLTSFGQFKSSFVSLEQTQEESFKRIIDNTYEPFLNRNTFDQNFKVKLQTIRNTLVSYLNTTKTSDAVFFALEYLVYRIEQTTASYPAPLPQVQITTSVPQPLVTAQPSTAIQTTTSTTTIAPTPVVVQPSTVTPTPQEVVPSVDVSRFYQGDKNTLAGTTSEVLFKYELIAQLEGVLIEQLAFAANTPDFEKAVKNVMLYDEQGRLIAEERPRTNQVVFRNIDWEIPTGQSDLYLAIESETIGYNSSAPQMTTFSLDLDIQESTGLISGNRLSVNTHSSGDSVTIVPALITHVLLTSEWENRMTDQKLHSGDNDLAILVVGNRTGANTSIQSGRSLTTQIERISITVDDNTTLGNVAYNMYLTPENSSDSVQGNLYNSNEVIFDLTALGNDAILSDQEETAFVISSDIPTLDPVNQESVTIKLVSTDENGIVYKTSDPTSLSISDLNLKTKVTNKITLID